MMNAMRWLAVAALVALVPAALMADKRARNPDEARSLIARAQEDVRKASSFANINSKERERFNHALKSLAEVDRSFSKDKYNEDRLDRAIEDMQNIVDHNTIASEDRDLLRQDLSDLRALREEHE